MKIIVLGSAAGGGFPQWNCNCRNCAGIRNGTVKARARTQSSIVVSSTPDKWILINASPDILSQIKATPDLQPAKSPRDSGIAAVMLTDAQIDHVAGLLMLREGKPLPLYCTGAVWNDLNTALPLAKVLSSYCGVQWHPLPVADPADARHPGDTATMAHEIDGLRITPIAIKSKAPPYSMNVAHPRVGDNIGLGIEDMATGRVLFYAPGLDDIHPQLDTAMRHADCLLVDGTFWTDDEMIQSGFSKKKAKDMGHRAQSGSGGMIELLDEIGPKRKILIHINNTNPILDENSAERALLARKGIEVAFDGMEIAL